MAEKQLSILVTARDQASGTLSSVGRALDEMAAKAKAKEIAIAKRQLASGEKITGKDVDAGGIDNLGQSLNKTLRAARGLFLIFEALPTAVNIFKAIDAGIFGGFDDKVAAQRKLVNGLKEIPIVGKPVGEFAEWLGGQFSHMFGRQNLAEQEADIKAQKKNLKKFQTELAKADQEVTKSDDQVKLLGLAPGEEEIEKAKVQYQKTIEGLRPYKQAVAAGVAAGQDVSGLVRDIVQIEENAKKVQADALAKANNKILTDEMAFSEHMREAAVQRANAIEQIEEQVTQKKLEAQNRGFEAEMTGLQRQSQHRIAAIQEDAKKREAELDRQAQELKPAADAGSKEAMQKRAQMAQEAWDIEVGSNRQQIAEVHLGQEEAHDAREKELREAHLAILHEQAEAGDQLAEQKLKELEYSRKQEATENALNAIINDTNATEQERVEAAERLAELKKAAEEHSRHENEKQQLADANQQREIAAFLLQRQAEAGDKAAAVSLKQLEIAQQYTQERQKLQGIIDSTTASNDAKAQAKQALSQMDSQEAKDMALAMKPKDTEGEHDHRASVLDSNYLRGVGESVAEKNEFQPLIDGQKEHASVLREMAGHLKEFLRIVSTPGSRVALR